MGGKDIDELNQNKTNEIFNFIIKYFEDYGFAPSVRDIGNGVHLKSTGNVYRHLLRLEEQGLIEMYKKEKRGVPRAIRVPSYKFVKREEC